MKKSVIKIAHLYYDLMNLYGETANIKAIKKFIERQGIDVQIKYLTIGDSIDFQKYDFYYMGAGSLESQKLVLKDIIKYKEDIKRAIEEDKMFLVTGNAMEIFGKKIRFQDGSSLECLGVFEYQAYEQERRFVSEIIYKYDKLPINEGNTILGFKNCGFNIVHNSERMFGFANNVNRKSFYGMNFMGPFLIRNPYFTNMLVEKLFEKKDYEYKPITDTLEFTAYHEFLSKFVINNDLD